MNTKSSHNTHLYKIYIIVLATSINVGVKSGNDFPFCPKGWNYYESTNKCFKYITTKFNLIKAKNFCKNKSELIGSHLAQPVSRKETLFICSLNKGIKEFMWAGYHKDKHVNGVFRDERNNQTVDTGLFDWDTGEPNRPHDKCLLLSKTCKWHDGLCKTPNLFACEFLDANSCQFSNNSCDQVCNPTALQKNNCRCFEGYTFVGDKCVANGWGKSYLVALAPLLILVLASCAVYFWLKRKTKQESEIRKHPDNVSTVVSEAVEGKNKSDVNGSLKDEQADSQHSIDKASQAFEKTSEIDMSSNVDKASEVYSMK